MSERQEEIARLWTNRPRNRRVEFSWWLLAGLLLLSLLMGNFSVTELLSSQRLANAKRFLGELLPFPLQKAGFSFSGYSAWFAEFMDEKGFDALVITLAISVCAIVFAGFFGFLASLLAARTIVLDECLSNAEQSCIRCRLRLIGLWVVRIVLLFFRSVPEYIWAFVLLMVLGVSAWPAILALALHNIGILGKLNSEFIDDLPQAPLMAMRHAGADRGQIGLLGAVPMVFNRFLLFFFVRWETCVRESTVLGLLGIISLGYWIEDARSRNHYDIMFHLVLLGALLVMLGDLVSTLLRAVIRRL